ncbi:MAG: hypothetical protein ABH952_03255 [Candidatus Omnitrophota bacterium]
MTYSMLLCHVYRELGINAKINFGAKRKTEKQNPTDLNTRGHCWVTIDEQELEMPYELIFKYP